MGSYPMVINVSPRPYVGRTIFISGELLRRRFVVGIHLLSYAVAGGIEAQGSFTGRGCFGTHGNGHVSSPRVRHVCISWDTVVKLPLALANPWPRLSRALLVSLVRLVFPLQTLRSHAKTRFPPRDRSRGSAEPDVRGQRGPNCRQSYRPATHPLLPSVVPPPPPSRQQWYGQADRRASGVKGGRTPGEWMKGGWIRQTGCSTVSCPFVTDIWPTRGPCTPPEIQHVRDRYARDIYRHACRESSLKGAHAYQAVCVALSLEFFLRIGRPWDAGSPGAACVSRTQSTLSSAAFLRIPLVSRGYSTKLELDPSVTQVTELNQVAKLYGVCAQDNEALRFRAAESLGNFGIESRGSLRAVVLLYCTGIGQGLRWKQSRVLTSYGETRQVLRQIKVLIFCFNMKKSAAEAHRMLSNTYGEAAISERTCREWFQRFKNGDFDVEGSRMLLPLQNRDRDFAYGQITPQLAIKVLLQFDKAINQALATRVKSRLTFKAGKLNTYRFCDNVWTFMLNDVEFREVQEVAIVDKVKIVACDGKTLDADGAAKR
ncbi:Transcription initiation factor IIA subunit 2 [Trachymyrmex cornetzi]|uniref:Transcription initiation factor IIA subunit 2 n=2 Tax=Aculeata TaxID=7434 RepID=A0A151J1S4_9HYME|nr:Transcription initiation factor IIA subunit 2 [Trachymyrmex cornetzi]